MTDASLIDSFKSRLKPVAKEADVVQSIGDIRSIPSESRASPETNFVRSERLEAAVLEIQQDNSLCLHPTEKGDFAWLLEDAALLAARDGWPVFVQKLTPPSKRYTNDLNVWFRGAAAIALVHVERCEDEAIDALLRSELADIAWWRANWMDFKRAETRAGQGWTHEAADLMRRK